MSTLKIGLIGLRGHAERMMHIVDSLENCTIKKIYLHREDQDVRVVTDIEALLDMDIIIQASPTTFHAEQINALQSYKGHFFCEKPIALSRECLKKLRGGLWNDTFYVNYCFLHSPVGKLLKDVVDSKKYGKLVHFNITFSHPGAHKFKAEDWRFSRTGGILNTSLSHMIHFVQSLSTKCYFSKPKCISALNKGQDTAIVDISLNNCHGTLMSTWASVNHVNIQFMFTNAILQWDGECVTQTSLNNKFENRPSKILLEKDITSNYHESLHNSFATFLKGVTTGTQDPVVKEYAFKTEELLLDFADQ